MARTRGAKGSIGATAKENIIAVFTRLGGTAAMAEWAKENQTDFYRLYAKLVPQQVDVDVTVRPCDVSANPLPASEWDSRYGTRPLDS
jgi:hypothetical protein